MPKLKTPKGCNSIRITDVKNGEYGKEYEILYGWKHPDLPSKHIIKNMGTNG